MKRWMSRHFHYGAVTEIGNWLDEKEQEFEDMKLESVTAVTDDDDGEWLVIISYRQEVEK